MDKEKYLECFNKFIFGMIKKDKGLLDESLYDDAKIIHMTGLVESKNEYINDILNGTLNYYDYDIISFNEKEVIIKLLAKVYGNNKSWWRLIINTEYVLENNILKIKTSKVRLG